MRRAPLLTVAAALLLSSCVDGTPPVTAVGGPVSLAIVPRVTLAGQAALETLPINRIRATVVNPATGATLHVEVVDGIDPGAESWDVTLNFEAPAGVTSVDVLLELINVTGGVETVQWSGRALSISVGNGTAPVVSDVEIFPGPPANLSVESVTLSGGAESILEGETTTFNAAVVGGGAGTAVVWSTLDPILASIDATGTVEGLLPGTARIVASAGPRADTASVIVEAAVAEVELGPVDLEVPTLGREVQFAAVVRDGRGDAVEGATLTWTTSAPDVAESLGNGLFRTVGTGSAQIGVSVVGFPDVGATTSLSVVQEAATITVSPESGDLGALGATVTLGATAKDVGGFAIPGATFTWSSSAPAVVTVDAAGVARAVANGNATVTATLDGVSGSATIRVRQTVARLEGPAPLAFSALEQVRELTVSAFDARGNAVGGVTPTWTSSNPEVVVVDGATARSRAAGSAVLSATAGAATVTVSAVVDPEVTTVSITPTSTTLDALGGTSVLSAAVRDANGFTVAGASVAWSSSNPLVATVAPGGTATAVGAGTTTVTATAGGVVGTATLIVAPKAATVQVTPGSATLEAFGAAATFTAVAKDAGGTVLPGVAIVWSSSDPGVAPVTAGGVLTATTNGTTTVTATADGITGTATLTVAQKVSTVKVSPPATTLAYVGETRTLNAVAEDANGHIVSGAPFTWTSSAPSLVDVDVTGVVTAVGAGTATVTASSGGVQGTSEVTVVPSSASVEITPNGATFISLGDTLTFTAVVRDPGGTPRPEAAVTWTSSNPSMVSVSSSGAATALADGGATITATSDGVSASVAASVARIVASVVVSPAAETLTFLGQRRTLTATALDGRGNGMPGAPMAWTTSDVELVSVDAQGEVLAQAPGTATVTATSGAQSGSSTITVAQAPASIGIYPTSVLELEPGDTLTLGAEVHDAGESTIVGALVTWSSDDPSVASVTSSGRVSAVAQGVTTLRATAGDVTATASVTVSGDVVFDGDLTIDTDQGLVDFAAAGITRVTGTLSVDLGSMMTTTLEDLSSLERVDGDLLISGGVGPYPGITGAAGLGNLVEVGGSFLVENLQDLVSLDAVSSLVSVGGFLELRGLTELRSEANVPALTEAGGLFIDLDGAVVFGAPALARLYGPLRSTPIVISDGGGYDAPAPVDGGETLEEISLPLLECASDHVDLGGSALTRVSLPALDRVGTEACGFLPSESRAGRRMTLRDPGDSRRGRASSRPISDGEAMRARVRDEREERRARENAELGITERVALQRSASVDDGVCGLLGGETPIYCPGVSVIDAPSLSMLDLGDLRTVEGRVVLTRLGVGSVALPSLASTGGLQLDELASGLTVSAPALATSGSLDVEDTPGVLSLSFPALSEVGGISLYNLETVTFVAPVLEEFGSLSLYDTGGDHNISLGTVGTELTGDAIDVYYGSEDVTITAPGLTSLGAGYSYALYVYEVSGSVVLDLPEAGSIGSIDVQAAAYGSVELRLPALVSSSELRLDAGNPASLVEVDAPLLQTVSGTVEFGRIDPTGRIDAPLPSLTVAQHLFVQYIEGALATDLSALTTITDRVSYQGQMVGAPDDFPALTTVGSDLSFYNVTTGALDLTFPVLSSVGRQFVLRGSAVNSVYAPTLTDIADELVLYQSGLTSLALPQLQSLGDRLYLWGNTTLSTLDLPSLTTISGQLSLTNNALTDLDGLAAITSAVSTVYISANDSLTSVSGLSSIGDALAGGCSVIGSFTITDNTTLPQSYAQALLDTIEENSGATDVCGTVTISGNALPG